MKMSPFALANRGVPFRDRVTKTAVRAAIRRAREFCAKPGQPIREPLSGMEAIRMANRRGWL